MAINADAYEEAAQFARVGRIGIPRRLDAELHVSENTPRVGTRLRVQWAVRPRRPGPAVVRLSLDGRILSRDPEGALAFRVFDRELRLSLMFYGQEIRHILIRPQVREPELLGAELPPRLFHDEACILQWEEAREVVSMVLCIESPGLRPRNLGVAPEGGFLNLGRFESGVHRIGLELQSEDSALSARGRRRMDFQVTVQERPPRLLAWVDSVRVEAGSPAILHWLVEGAETILLAEGLEEELAVAAAGERVVPTARCGEWEWHFRALAPRGAESLATIRMSVVAPEVELDIRPEARDGESPWRLAYRCLNAVQLEIRLPAHEATPVPLAGWLEMDDLFTSQVQFLARALDERIHCFGVQIAPLTPRLPPIEALCEVPALVDAGETLFNF